MRLGCPLCGDDSAMALSAMVDYSVVHPGAGVCGPCATVVANAFWMKHGGSWLTWPNEPVDRPKKAVITLTMKKAVFERDQYRCKQCGGFIDLTVDHVVPESQGGPTELHNLQTLCRPCNSRKGTR